MTITELSRLEMTFKVTQSAHQPHLPRPITNPRPLEISTPFHGPVDQQRFWGYRRGGSDKIPPCFSTFLPPSRMRWEGWRQSRGSSRVKVGQLQLFGSTWAPPAPPAPRRACRDRAQAAPRVLTLPGPASSFPPTQPQRKRSCLSQEMLQLSKPSLSLP